MNVITLIGNVGRDPEIRTTTAGTKVASFGLATNERWKNSDGEKQEKVTWHNCVVFGALATVVEDWVVKGGKIMVSGRLDKRKYTSRDGEEKEAVEVVVQQLELLGQPGGKRKERDNREDDDDGLGGDLDEKPRRRRSTTKKEEKQDYGGLEDDLDDDIPF